MTDRKPVVWVPLDDSGNVVWEEVKVEEGWKKTRVKLPVPFLDVINAKEELVDVKGITIMLSRYNPKCQWVMQGGVLVKVCR